MSTTYNAKSVHRILFSEKPSEYHEWITKTQAIADGHGYGRSLKSPKQVIPTAASLLLSTATAEDKKIFSDNAQGFTLLTLSTTKVSFGLVELAEGNAFDAVTLLNNHWAPNAQEDLVALQSEWSGCTMSSPHEEPTAWFVEISRLSKRFAIIDPDFTKKEWELKAHVIGNLPETYDGLLPTFAANSFTYAKHVQMITNHWKTVINKGKAKGKDAEMALAAFAAKKFKGHCNHCGKQGHKTVDCWAKHGKDGNGKGKKVFNEKKNWTGQPDTRTCYNCQAKGHISRDCPKKKESGMVCVEEFVGTVTSFDSFFDDWVTEDLPRGEDKEIEWEFVGVAMATDDDICDDNSGRSVKVVSAESNKVEIEEPAECSDKDEGDDANGVPELIIRDSDNSESDESCEETPPRYRETVSCIDEYDIEGVWVYVGDGMLVTGGYTINPVPPRNDYRYFYGGPSDTWRKLKNAAEMEKYKCNDSTPDPDLSDDDFAKTEREKNKEYSDSDEDSESDEDSDSDEESDSDDDGDQDGMPLWIEKDGRNVNAVMFLDNGTKPKKGQRENWLVDSGATVHVTNDDTGMTDIEPSRQTVVIGDGKKLAPEKKGTIQLRNKKGQLLKLRKVLHVPEFGDQSVISVTALINEHASGSLETTAAGCVFAQNGARLEFEKQGQMFYHNCSRVIDEEAHALKTVATMDINEAHDKLGHFGESMLRKTCSDAGTTLTGVLQPCDGCLRAKAQRKALSKVSTSKATEPGERICIDISGPYTPSIRGTLYWGNMVCEHTNKTWNVFMKHKSDFPSWVLAQIDAMKVKNKIVKFIRLDNAGENNAKLKKGCTDRNITMEYTAPNTPQTNGVSERRFKTDRDRALAMMFEARLDQSTRDKLWAEAVNAASNIGNLGVTGKNEKSCNEMYTGVKSKGIGMLIQFGRIGYVTIRTKIKKKMIDKTIKCINLGPAEDHSSETYRLYNPETEKVILSRDVKWAAWNKVDPTQDLTIFEGKVPKAGMGEDEELYETTEDEVDEKAGATLDDEPIQDVPRKGKTVFSPARTRAASKAGRIDADTSAKTNLTATLKEPPELVTARRVEFKLPIEEVETEATKELATEDDAAEDNAAADDATEEDTTSAHFVYNASIVSDPGTPTTYREALAGADSKKWHASLLAELNNFTKRGSWAKVERATVAEKGRKLIPQKWVLKKKNEQDGSIRFKSRSVTKGYMQVPGVDFTESFSPVATDSTIRIGIGLTLFYEEENWICEVFDVEAAFLNADIDIEMYAEWPEGSVELGFLTQEEHDKYCIQMLKSQYGNVDAALRWTRTFAAHLTKIGMIQSQVDPCLFYKKDPNNGKIVLLVICFVDDQICNGTKTEIEWLKKKVRERFNIQDLGRLKKFLGIWYEWGRDNDGPFVKATMNDMAATIVEDYEKHVGHPIKGAKTPGFPGTTLTKGEDDQAEGIDTEKYRSLVGKIMYYVTKIAPDCANAARELSQYMARPTLDHWKAVERLVAYIKEKKSHHLVYRKPRELRVIGSADANYATNPDDRKSISGSIHTVGGMITSWSSKKQSSVTLSSAESEYFSAAEHMKETRFQQMLLDEIATNVYPSVVYEDNQGCIFLVKNRQVGSRTKHMDVRMHWIRNEVAAGRVIFLFVPSEEMECDGMTKNVPERLFQYHVPNMLNGTLRSWREDVKMSGLSSNHGAVTPAITSVNSDWKSV
jgi:hypothetical protein